MIRRPPRSTLFPYTNALPIYFCTPTALDRRTARLGHLGLRNEWRVDGFVDDSIRTANCLFCSGRFKKDSRSEEHTSELQSLAYLVCRLLLEKKKKKKHSLSIT